MRSLSILAFILLVGLITAIASAGTPTMINYQGILTDGAGNPVPNGSYSIVFTIYDASVGGAASWTEAQSVTTLSGSFAVLLGSTMPITDAVFAATTRYLGVKVGTDPEMTPRVALVTVPYAFRVSTVDGSSGGAVSGNISLENSTAIAGNIWKGTQSFLHNFSEYSTFIGQGAGNFSMTGVRNTACGAATLATNTTGNRNVAIGDGALVANKTGNNNTASGHSALQSNIGGDGNTASGYLALSHNTEGTWNTASGFYALQGNSGGSGNTASGFSALSSNTTGSYNTAIGQSADVSAGDLTNATAIGSGAIVNASNKIRLGDDLVTVIEGQVAYTFTSDRNQKENFQPVDGHEVLRKIRGLSLTSWNYRNHDPQKCRHYGPVAQEFYGAFGHDGVGESGTPTTINSGDLAGITLIAVQALEKETERMKADNMNLRSEIEELREMVIQLLAQSKEEISSYSAK